MGLYDREYTQAGYGSGGGYHVPQMRIGFPPLTPIVKMLLILNGVVFVLQYLDTTGMVEDWFAVWPKSVPFALQVWRLVTYQFLHANLGHILINMLCLYMFGSMLESHWPRKTFLWFYLGCGAVGGGMYPLLLAVHVLNPDPTIRHLVGASGSIMGVIAACAILFPQMRVYVWGIFPIPIRVLAVAVFVISLVVIHEEGTNAGGEAAHFGGMVAGAIYVWSQTHIDQWFYRFRHKRRHRQMEAQYRLEQEVDRILEKVQQSGIHSLTSREKSILKKATDLEQRRRRSG